MASVTDTAFAAGEPLAAYHLGAGGLTLPRYLSATRPGTSSEVSEIDAGVVAADVRLLGGSLPDGVEVDVEDGRLAIDELAPDSLDLVVGDAFGGVSVPWHLATRRGRRRARGGAGRGRRLRRQPDRLRSARLRPRGRGDDGGRLRPRGAARRALRAGGRGGGNLVVVASDAPLDVAAVVAQMGERDLGWDALEGDGLDAWIGDAPVLNDDFAPVDQLLTPYAR